ncbi:P-loop NTPase fold protein [Comamonas terrigena]|uniref:KAP NTPase domain-containing protein n=1 Tax=Comamonas terrigena TaxID=32013 RepID=A0A2A7UY93_COMTR|nr:P-loop NTPase fold protein [Comamonas terrigena]PEH90272.1 hypothetical protein CRM82_18265 [Comamonas terrigena]BBL25608.1 hypothetical protein CT3_30630 [Comamonas terrigena NBRC 13299]SUY70824.1 Predicted P-loop ATPase [Comamonas terrigena]
MEAPPSPVGKVPPDGTPEQKSDSDDSTIELADVIANRVLSGLGTPLRVSPAKPDRAAPPPQMPTEGSTAARTKSPPLKRASNRRAPSQVSMESYTSAPFASVKAAPLSTPDPSLNQRSAGREEELNESNAPELFQQPVKVGEIEDDAKLQEAKRRMSETLIASPMNDDAWDGKAVDRLGFSEDAKAFARVVASKDVRPPLAIAVFGSWGSGKSFFMRLVHDHVAELAKGDYYTKAPEGASGSFHSRIVQVRFNAWHYSETNLWASLVDHLFTQLGSVVDVDGGRKTDDERRKAALLENLGTTRLLTVESAERLADQRRTQKEFADKLAAAEQARLVEAAKVVGRPATYLDIAHRVLADDSELRTQLQEAANSLGITNLEVAKSQIQASLEATNTLAGESRIVFNSVSTKLGSKIGAALAFACIPAAPLLAWCLKELMQDFDVSHVTSLLTSAATCLIALSIGVRRLHDLAGPVLRNMRVVKAKVDEVVALAMKEHDDAVEEAQTALSRAEADIVAAKQDLAASAGNLAKAVEDFHGATGSGRLRKFLQARATDGHYAKHLGLIASVRRDFEELSRGMQSDQATSAFLPEEAAALLSRIERLEANDSGLLPEDKRVLEALRLDLQPDAAKKKKLELPFERLVLYIDDLDRCSHEKVIEVLQAVHMLLAFPLFTVFVAVDVRWLSQALLKQYGSLLKSDSGVASAAPHDYLEKIFQLPYWIEEVNGKSGKTLLEGLIPVDNDIPSESDTSRGQRESQQSSGLTPSAHREPRVYSLTFKTFHRDSMALFIPYFATVPRKILWYANAFRVMKATSRSLNMVDDVEHDFIIILQLALANISASDYETWLRIIESAGGAPTSLSEFHRRLSKTTNNFFFRDAVKKAGSFAEENLQILVFEPQLLLQYGRRAKRFCFGTS